MLTEIGISIMSHLPVVVERRLPTERTMCGTVQFAGLKNMSNFLRHQPCPDCGSKDNCGVYDDGHEWCFGCGYYKGAVGWKKIVHELRPSKNPVHLPIDVSANIPQAQRDWYRRYLITDVEAGINNFRWSANKKWLIMPVYNLLGTLELFQARCFGTGPKYFTEGSPSGTDHIIGNKSSKCLFVVEDVLSAIKIGRIATAMPIFGSDIADHKLLRLSRRYDTIVIWLDYDKVTDGLRLRMRAKNIFQKAYVAGRVHDPKALPMDEIRYITKNFIAVPDDD